MITLVPVGTGDSTGRGASGSEWLMVPSLARAGRSDGVGLDRIGRSKEGTVSSETLIADEEVVEIGEVEELLVEEVSIDGLCGVY